MSESEAICSSQVVCFGSRSVTALCTSLESKRHNENISLLFPQSQLPNDRVLAVLVTYPVWLPFEQRQNYNRRASMATCIVEGDVVCISESKIKNTILVVWSEECRQTRTNIDSPLCGQVAPSKEVRPRSPN